MRTLRTAVLALPLALAAATGCVEVLDQTPTTIARSGDTLEVFIDRSSASVTEVEARFVNQWGSVTMTAAGGNRWTAPYTPDPCADYIALYYRITYYDQDAQQTKTKNEPADGFFYKELSGIRPSGCPQTRRFVANRTQDVDDANIGDGACYAGAPAYGCTLRAAVQEANSDSVPDIIQLVAGTYTLSQVGDDDDAGAGDLDLLFDVAIVGSTRNFTRIRSGVDGEAVFHVGAGGRPYVDVTLRDLTIDGDQRAQAIDNEGALRIEDAVIEDGWKSGGGGGGIESSGFLDMERVEVKGGYALLGTGGGVMITDGTARIRKSAFHDNRAVQHGGAISVIGTGTLVLEDSTLYDNRADVYGGGLFVNPDLNAQVRNVTITQNRSRANGGAGAGGGIFHEDYAGGLLYLSNSIVAGNENGAGGLYTTTSDCDGDLASYGGNLVGIASVDCIVDGSYSSGTDQIGESWRPVNPYLGNPASWPPALAPTTLSPALSAATTGDPNQANFLRCTREDQLGRARTGVGPCDVGAIQVP